LHQAQKRDEYGTQRHEDLHQAIPDRRETRGVVGAARSTLAIETHVVLPEVAGQHDPCPDDPDHPSEEHEPRPRRV
jgi:hypothetical protein